MRRRDTQIVSPLSSQDPKTQQQIKTATKFYSHINLIIFLPQDLLAMLR